jgi:2-polyprenyl-3-methyl-5-hydroxy-6-metoxy-1,4-benzoquinol methylase
MAICNPEWTETAERQIEDTADLLGSVDWSGKRVLDVGCWWGWFILYARQQGAHAVGLDCENSRIRDAAHYLQSSSGLCVADGLHLPFPADTFDVVVSIHVLEHVSADGDMIGEFRRILKPGGVLLISVPNEWSFGILPYRPLRALIRGKMAGKLPLSVHRYVKSLSFSDLSHHREYTARSLQRLLHSNGLQVEQVWRHGLDLPYPLKGRISQRVRQRISLSMGKAVPEAIRTSVSAKAKKTAKERG